MSTSTYANKPVNRFGFLDRKQMSERFQTAVIRAINTTQVVCEHGLHAVENGIEHTPLHEHHQKLIHFKDDPTTRFLRHRPDSVLVDSVLKQTMLMDFKYSNTLLTPEKMKKVIKHPVDPDFNYSAAARNLLGIEANAYDMYKLMSLMGLRVVLFARASWREDDNSSGMFAEYVDRLVLINRHQPAKKSGGGSGTEIANLDLTSFRSFKDFLTQETSMSEHDISVVRHVINYNLL